MGELAVFLLVGFGLPILAASPMAIFLRANRPHWSISKKAWIAGTPLLALELALAVFLIAGSYSNLKRCPAGDVCDMPALGLAVGMMVLIVAVIAYVLSALVAYLVLNVSRTSR